MVQSKNVLSLLILPTLALSSGLHARHGHHHKPRAINWVYTTKVVATTTVTYGHVPTQESKAEVNEAKIAPPPPPPSQTTLIVTPSPVAAPPPPPPAPVLDEAPKDPEPQKPKDKPSTSTSAPQPEHTSSPSKGEYPQGISGQFLIKNNCDYDVTMTIDRTKCGAIETGIHIGAGQTWNDDITSCDDANPSYKIFRVGSDKNPLQFEAGYKPSQKTLWYNISLKDCVTDMHGQGIENCPGNAWYLDAKSSAPNPGASQTLQCDTAKSCCTRTLGAYCDAWATASKDNLGEEPVGGCLGDLSQIKLVGQIC